MDSRTLGHRPNRREHNMSLEDVARTVAKDLYRAEVRRQTIGWDNECTRLLVRSQHALAAAVIATEESN
jgi:hypothetical protein